MQTFQNISLCQINVKSGQTEYYLPKNANWRNKKIEKIVVYAHDPNVSVTSPVDDQACGSRTDISDLYFDLYNTAGENIMHNVHAYELLDVNNFPPIVGQQLSFDLSKIFFTSAPVSDYALMLYVFYNAKESEVEDSTENVTVNFTVPAKTSYSLQYVIENYMYARSKGVRAIAIWNDLATLSYNSGFVTLRDTSGFLAHEDMPTYFFRPVNKPASGDVILRNHIPLAAVDLDFNNSFVYNPHNTDINYTVTFYS